MASARTSLLRCDGCGQLAAAGHIARRLQRLEWATRYRPVHIQALLLGRTCPTSDSDFLYSPEGHFAGEAREVLEAAQISPEGKSGDAVLSEFQKRGLMLTHLVECPPGPGLSDSLIADVLRAHLPAAIVRIRRSLKPKRIIVIGVDLLPALETLQHADLGCPVFHASSSPFFLEGSTAVIDFHSARPAAAGSNGV